MPFKVSAMRFMRAKGDGVADMRVNGDVSVLEVDIFAEYSCICMSMRSSKGTTGT